MVSVHLQVMGDLSFESIAPLKFKKSTVGYYVPCPFDIDSISDLDYLPGSQVIVDGRVYRCDTVEINALPPLKKGGQIALWLTKITAAEQH